MTGSGSGSKGLYITIGVIIVILIVWGFYTKLNEIDEKVDMTCPNSLYHFLSHTISPVC